MSAATASNQFFIYMGKNCIPWDIYEADSPNPGFVAYFSKVLQTVDQKLQKRGLTFYVTMTEVDELPSYGENVVVLILGDEFYRVPKYCHKVGAIFKCYGTHQLRHQLLKYCSPLYKISYLKILTMIQLLKNFFLHRLLLKLNRRFYRFLALLIGTAEVAPIVDIPPGYYNSKNLPIERLEIRSHDIFFDGSINHDRYPIWSLKSWMKTPKAVSRQQMVSNLNKFAQQYPQFNIKLATNSAFGKVDRAQVESYSASMMNTKICLAPRGTTFETYRFFEAMRYGCIIITEPLPLRWYYRGAPVIELADWNSLEIVLKNLLSNPQLMQELHQQTLKHWETHCSEAAIGGFIAGVLNGLLAARFSKALTKVEPDVLQPLL